MNCVNLLEVFCLVLQEAESATGGEDMESRLSEVEGRLKETERERDSYKDVR